jgi:hypothetical protein
VIGDLDSLVIADEAMSFVDGVALICWRSRLVRINSN